MVQFNVPNCFSGDCDCGGTPPPSSFCPYGDCFSCIPSQCEGPQCCCCASVDVAQVVRANCFRRVFFSCNKDGTASGPGLDPFPPTCSQCFDACDRALGGDVACASISQHVNDSTWDPSPAEWFNFPLGVGPCDCECVEFTDPGNPGAGCNLTCVKCDGHTCKANIETLVVDCGYQFIATPSEQCCGTPAIADIVFVIDYSGSMGSVIEAVKTSAFTLAQNVSLARFGLLVFGRDNSCQVGPGSVITFPGGNTLTTSPQELQDALNSVSIAGGSEPDFDAVGVALQTYPWTGVTNLLFLISDERIDNDCGPPSGDLSAIGAVGIQPSVAALSELANSLGVTIFTIQHQHIRFDPRKKDLALSTAGGQDLDLNIDFSTLLEDIELDALGASCACLENVSIPIEICRGGVGPSGECIDPDVNIPIGKCIEEDNSDCNICGDPLTIFACGEIIIIEPNDVNLVCCGDLEGGCNCPAVSVPDEGCCGIACSGIDICQEFEGSTLQAAIDATWGECWTKARNGEFILVTQGCSRPTVPEPSDPEYGSLNIDAIENCVIKVPDGIGGYNDVSRPQIVAEVTAAWAACAGPDEPPPPPSISEASCLPECDRQDECIVGEPVCSDADIRVCRASACSTPHEGCTSVKNPDTVVLNNGIGLVAYESMEKVSVIKIEQFNTSVPAKILPNRRTNYGRLQHSIRWEDPEVASADFKLVKMYYFEDLATHFINGLAGPPAAGSIVDTIVFRNGPLQNQCFSLDDSPVGPTATDTDEIGNFIRFTVPNDTVLSNEFPSIDDVYNIEWFIIDSDDTGLIGSTTTPADVPGGSFLLDDANVVNSKLELSPHIHDGKPVPVAYPSIATAHNYMNAVENSHYIYLVYQALEDQKWNLYMRQLRLSEYSRDQAIDQGGMESLVNIGITEVVYRSVCVTDECEAFGNDFLAKRVVTLEVALRDGRDVFNSSLLGSTDSWTVCPGEPDGSFPKKKVIVEFTHSAIVNRCPDQFEFNEMFYNWEVGDEFSVPFSNLTTTDLFTLLEKPNDEAISLGEQVSKVSGIDISSSQVAAIWYEDKSISSWVAPNTATFQDLLQYKGMDISEPIPITEFENGHCTHPVVAVNANNEIFVIYECTDPDVHQIHMTGTAIPSTSFPLGIFTPKNLDANLDYFLSPSDFTYRNSITVPGEGINQLPDMYIDANDVVHVSWQSNRSKYWEIYYANSEEQFKPKRITNFNSKSLKPSITGDIRGNLHVAWHDDRFGNWEIMMAYRDDERVLTLLEQDPYLAGVRNFGYSHSTDVVPLEMKNEKSSVLCLSNLIVRFFTDRLLAQPAFDVFQSSFPMAFQIPGMEMDRSTITLVYADLTNWEPGTEKTVQATTGNMFSPNDITQDSQGRLSDGIDTNLAGSSYDTINIIFTVQPLFVRFAAGDTPDMNIELLDLKQEATDSGSNPDALTNSDTTWKSTAYITAGTLQSGTDASVESMVSKLNTNVPEAGVPTISTVPRGRYKKMFITMPSGSDFTDSISSIKITSVLKDRFCIGPDETITGSLDVTPFIRVDSKGNETVETPIPVGINKNQTYFTAVIATKDDGTIVVFGDPKRSFSCETCVNDTSPWDSSSCSFSVTYQNILPEQETKFINVRVRFYADQGKLDLVAQFDAFKDKDGELSSFTTDDNQPAQDVWTNNGLEIFFEKSRTITLWPMLSNTSGLMCGVEYWVSTEICVGNTEFPCARSDLKQETFETWSCNCGSPRWEERFGDTPENIRDKIQWISSGDGFSDTRLTETGPSVHNYNPIIKLRTDLTGIVVYESNRDDPDRLTKENEKHTLYGTAFSIFPGLNMYASGAESITTKFGEILIRSDIPISSCNGSDCDDSETAMEGRNANFVFDQYDNMFLAAENFSDQTTCSELEKDTQRSIIVHRCGIQSKNLVFTPEETGGVGIFACDPSEVLGKTAPLAKDITFKKIIKLARVNNKSAKYHITRLRKPTAVVDQCNIQIDIITEPETIAVRLKNENEDKSTWFPFDPDIGENTIRIPWILSAGSGVKTVTIEAAAYQGLSTSFSLSIIADYKGIDHTINFYKLIDKNAATPNPAGVSYDDLLAFLNTHDAVFDVNAENPIGTILKNLEGVPVAGIRQPVTVKDEQENDILIKKTGEFIFIEIIPSLKYIEELGIIDNPTDQSLLPTFDVLQQGAQDLFSVPTTFDSVKNVFKGVFPVQKEDDTFYKDGLSFVIPHFQEDCSDISATLLSTSEYDRDKFNEVIPSGLTTGNANTTDVWENERDELGKIKHQFDIRGTEDPYFVFGDPNYRLKKQDE